MCTMRLSAYSQSTGLLKSLKKAGTDMFLDKTEDEAGSVPTRLNNTHAYSLEGSLAGFMMHDGPQGPSGAPAAVDPRHTAVSETAPQRYESRCRAA